MKKLILLSCIMLTGCELNKTPVSSDAKTANETEKRLAEASRQVDLPNIKNWREKRLAKEIYEKRDAANLITHTYIVDLNGKFHYLGQTVGYGLPYSTQYSNPSKIWDLETDGGAAHKMHDVGEIQVIPQAEPNGLFMPTNSTATWVMMKTPNGIDPQYIEPLISVFTFKLPDNHPSVECNVPLYQMSTEQ